MRSLQPKRLSPSIERTLPGLRHKTPYNLNLGILPQSRSGKLLTETQSSRNILSPPLRVLSPSDPFNESIDHKLSEEFKKLNSLFVDSSLNATVFKDFTFEETPRGQVANRKEARRLIEWLDFMLSQIGQEKFENPDKLFKITNEIYTACFYELAKQVSAHCKERGFLMMRLWKANQSLFEKASNIAKAKYEALKVKQSNETAKNQENLCEKLSLAEEKLLFARMDIESYQTKIKEQKEIIESKTAKESKMVYSVGILQAQYRNVKKELLALKEDARILKVRYENIGAENEYNNVLKRIIVPKRYKRKTSLELEKELEKDPLMGDFDSNGPELISNISKFGIFYIEKSLDALFNRDDFIDKSTETNTIKFTSSESQTELLHTCGDSIGVKSRKSKMAYTSSTRSKKPMFFPDFRPYNQRTLTLEASNLSANPLNPELKKKHLRIRRLLSTIKEVKNKQEYNRRA